SQAKRTLPDARPLGGARAAYRSFSGIRDTRRCRRAPGARARTCHAPIGGGAVLRIAMIYLDHNATSPLRDLARAAMTEAMADCGNASSVHSAGRAARARIERAREGVARLVGYRAS